MSRPYQTSFWSCFSPFDLCIKSCCCPCVVYGKNHYRTSHGTDQGYSACNGPCAGWCALTCCGHWGWILQLLNRHDMQDKYNLEGSGCTDCLKSWCCPCCEVIQTSKELDYVQISQHENGGYKQQSNMVADPKFAQAVAPGAAPRTHV